MTKEQIDCMSPEEKQISVAKLCGWTVVFNETKGLYELINPQGKWEHPHDADGEEWHCWNYVPRYLHSLNACREMEKALKTKAQSDTYVRHLIFLSAHINPDQNGHDHMFMFCHASTDFRVTSFLLTMLP